MMRGRARVQVGAVIVSLGMLVSLGGCASKRIESASGDQSALTKEKGGAAVPVETIRQEQLVSVEPPTSGLGEPRLEARGGQLTPSGLGDIFFNFDQYTIRNDAQPVLESNSRWLRNQQRKTLLIEGHCDERGTMAYNLVLGERRAQAARRYLQDLGVPAAQLQITSYGKERPFCKEHDEGCWQKNRRAHFVVR